ncbi:MAG TPA: PP2C family protein-serine/threonine phosphatase [Gaiellales bacterium]|nr:PP2C family protein-serine/threonine phosphatase [Gaiellales bacterium]
MPELTRRLDTRRARLAAALVAVLCELAIALPFLVISPNTVRGVPGPLLVVVGIVASYLLGPWLGVPVTAVGVVLAVTIVGENAWAEPLVWLPVSAGAGIAGEWVRHGDELRRELIEELRRGLVGIYRPPEVGRLNVVSRYIPAVSAQRIAGDFYGALVQPTGDVALMVGDVAGHGPAAAALATRLRAMWRGLAVAGVSDSETVRALNETLLAEQERIASPIPFATLCLATVAADLRSVRIVLAGHPPPILVTDRGTNQDPHPPGPAIGISEASAWEPHPLPLPDGPWSLVIYTDGLVEGRTSPAGPRPYGSDRLLLLLADCDVPLGEDDVNAVLQAVLDANGDALPDDVVLITASPR